jgi:hypothetical protein
VQRFERYEDLEEHKVTIEEREEYEQHIKAGTVVSCCPRDLRTPSCFLQLLAPASFGGCWCREDAVS